MIYLDNGATSFRKPAAVSQAVLQAMQRCANPGRGGYEAAMAAAEQVYRCREYAARMFGCQTQQVVFTFNCTHGLNIAIRSLVKPGSSVVISGFEHNAVTRPLYLMQAQVRVAGRKLFDPADTLQCFEDALRRGADVAVVTHVSNVFGYILPIEQIAELCRQYGVPLIVDAAQSAGILEIDFAKWGAEFVAMPGHKGLLGPQGTGILLCVDQVQPLIAGGTGSESERRQMPDFLPDRLEAGTMNVPGIAGLEAGMRYIEQTGRQRIFERERSAASQCAKILKEKGYRVYFGEHQSGTVSFVPDCDCEEMARRLQRKGIAVRAGLHCAPLAHESAKTLDTGTVRVSFGHDVTQRQINALEWALG